MSDDDDRAAILARRRRWIALAVAGAAVVTEACAQPCLSPRDGGLPDAGADAAPDADAPDAGD